MMPFSPKPLMNSKAKPSPPAGGGLSKTHVISLGGIKFVPHISGALYAPDFKTLLVADLHLEQGTSLARRGIHVPPYDTGMTLALLESVLAETRPWRLVLLGDSFHDAGAHAMIDADNRTKLLQITSETETIWISGNHDPEPLLGIGGICVAEHHLDHIRLRHQPKARLDHNEIAGHLHPGATVVQRGIAARGKCFVADGRRIIMPAFGAYTGALNVRSPAFANLLSEEQGQVWLIGKQAIHRLPLRRV
jgi:uncharacterized protein